VTDVVIVREPVTNVEVTPESPASVTVTSPGPQGGLGPQGTPGAANVGQIAFAQNLSGQGTTAPNGSSEEIIGAVVVVPPTDREIWLWFGASLHVSIGGQGNIYLQTFEISSGVATDGHNDFAVRCLTNDPNGAPSYPAKAIAEGMRHVGPSDDLRAYMLTVELVQEGSSLDAFSGGPGNPWIAAVAA
jgi:hypothetical protein